MSHDPRLARRQVGLLVLCQALLYTNNVALIAINGLAGLALAPTPAWATLPVTAYIVGAAATTYFASLAMGRYGRRAGFMLGAAIGVAGLSLATYAVLSRNFALLCTATFITGAFNAFWQYTRFAAADVAEAYDPSLKERAIAWALAGGLAGGVLGPELSKATRELLPGAFAGTYAALAVSALIALLVASRLRIPLKSTQVEAAPRPLAVIARQPAFVVAVLVGAVSYGAMNLLMTATPLAMRVCGFGYPDAADVIKWHVLAMFAPGFFTGDLMRRFGNQPVMLAGCGLMFVAIAVAHAGLSYWHFWVSLVALGIGWNFMFVAATALLTTTYTAAEKAKVQGVNDLAILVTMITSSASSGALLSRTGWTDLNTYAVPAVLLATAAALWLALRPQSKAATA